MSSDPNYGVSLFTGEYPKEPPGTYHNRHLAGYRRDFGFPAGAGLLDDTARVIVLVGRFSDYTAVSPPHAFKMASVAKKATLN